MAILNSLLLTVYRDKFAPFDPSQGKTVYSPPKSKGFLPSTIKQVTNVTEGGVTYGSFLHHETDGVPRTQILTIELSGAIITALNA